MDNDGQKLIAIDLLSHKSDKRRQQWSTMEKDGWQQIEMDND